MEVGPTPTTGTMTRYDNSLAKTVIGRKPRTLDDIRNLEEEERRGTSIANLHTKDLG